MAWGRTVVLYPRSAPLSREILPPRTFKPGWDLTTPYLLAHSSTTWRRDALIRAGGYDASKLLVEAPDLFLKVGDFAEQVYVPRIASFKRVLPTGRFRAELTEERKAQLSKKLVEETLARRFGVSPKHKDDFCKSPQ